MRTTLAWMSRRAIPEDNPAAREVPWGAGSIFLVWLVLVGVSLGVQKLLGGLGPGSPPAQVLWETAVINLALLVAIPALLRVTCRAHRDHLGFPRCGNLRGAGIGLLAGLVGAPAIYAIFALAQVVWPPRKHPVEEMLLRDPTAGKVVLAVVMAVVLAPAVEELLFRVVLQGWLTRFLRVGLPEPSADLDDPLDGPALAIEKPLPGAGRSWAHLPNLVTSGLFAALHSSEWPAPIPLFFLSLGLGALYRRTGRFVAPFAMHATFNAISTALLLGLLVRNGFSPQRPHPPAAHGRMETVRGRPIGERNAASPPPGTRLSRVASAARSQGCPTSVESARIGVGPPWQGGPRWLESEFRPINRTPSIFRTVRATAGSCREHLGGQSGHRARFVNLAGPGSDLYGTPIKLSTNDSGNGGRSGCSESTKGALVVADHRGPANLQRQEDASKAVGNGGLRLETESRVGAGAVSHPAHRLSGVDV